MSANPYANGGLLRKDLEMPDFRNYCLEVPKPGQFEAENTRPLGVFLHANGGLLRKDLVGLKRSTRV